LWKVLSERWQYSPVLAHVAVGGLCPPIAALEGDAVAFAVSLLPERCVPAEAMRTAQVGAQLVLERVKLSPVPLRADTATSVRTQWRNVGTAALHSLLPVFVLWHLHPIDRSPIRFGSTLDLRALLPNTTSIAHEDHWPAMAASLLGPSGACRLEIAVVTGEFGAETLGESLSLRIDRSATISTQIPATAAAAAAEEVHQRHTAGGRFDIGTVEVVVDASSPVPFADAARTPHRSVEHAMRQASSNQSSNGYTLSMPTDRIVQVSAAT
jgi:hypothetical protein